MKTEDSVDHQFVIRLNQDLDKICESEPTEDHVAFTIMNVQEDTEKTGLFTGIHEELFFFNNSPLTLSNNNSDNGDNGDNSDNEDSMDDSNDSFHPKRENRFVASSMLTHQDVELSLGKYYSDISVKQLNELDLLITYLKGQKHLFIKAKNVLQNKLNMLLIPCLIISSAITIFAPFIQEYNWSGGVVSGLNALIVFFISLSNYLKLESSIQTFHITANQYDKLETSLEFVSSKMLFIEDNSKKSHMVLSKIQDMEKKMSEIKDWNPLFVPEEVQRSFPIICNINIFSFIKRIELHRQNLIANLKDIKNEIRYILRHMEQDHRDHRDHEDPTDTKLHRMKTRLTFLIDVKSKIKTDLMHNRNAYGHIDELFTKEICYASRNKWMMWNTCFSASLPIPYLVETTNPVIDDFLRITFN
jgi:hypothetical protein